MPCRLSGAKPLYEPMLGYYCQLGYLGTPGGGTWSENCWGCAMGYWKLDPTRSRGKLYFGAKKIGFCEELYPKDRFCVGGWEKTPQKDRVWYPEGQKRGSKPRHICITHHRGSTPPPPGLGTNFSIILIKIQNFSFTKVHLKLSSAKWWPFCPRGDELTRNVPVMAARVTCSITGDVPNVHFQGWTPNQRYNSIQGI